MNPVTLAFSLGLAATLAFAPSSAASRGADAALANLTAQDPTSAPVDTGAPKAAAVLLLVQAFYDGTKDLEAKFKQTYHNRAFGAKTVTQGTLRLRKPGQMVWDYDGKADPDFYADGKNLWVVEHDTRQVIRKPIDGQSDVDAALKFLFGGQQLTREFKVKYADADKAKLYAKDGHHVLQLKPKAANPHYKGMILIVHATTGRVSSFVVYNNDGSTNVFELSELKTNTGLADGAFEFKTPKGYVETVER